MNRWLIGGAIVAAIVLCPTKSLAKTLTVAVIDTGIDSSSIDTKLCKFGHKSFTANGDPLQDLHGHGTHVAGLIREHAGNVDFCMVSLQFYADSNTGKQNLVNLRNALQYAINIKVDMINLSGGGPEFNEEEYLLIKQALKNKITVVVAAGNENSDLSLKCDYFPACYDKRLIIVGNLQVVKDWRRLSTDWQFLAILANMGPKLGTYETERAPSSNYGIRVNRWEIGTNVESTLPGRRKGKMTGTSQATAVATGKLISERLTR
jgi:subtilisin family serine protease